MSLAWTMTDHTSTPGLLIPEYGLHLQSTGEILDNSDSIFVSLIVNLPSQMDLPNTFIKDVTCDTFNYRTLHGLKGDDLIKWNHEAKVNNVHPNLFSYYVSMCTRSQDITLQAKYKVETFLHRIKHLYKDINVLLSNTINKNVTNHHSSDNHRRKRSLLTVLFGSAFKIISTVFDTIQARRITAVESSVSAMDNKLVHLHKDIADFQRSSYTTFQNLYGLNRNLTLAFEQAVNKGRKDMRLINERVSKFEFKLKRQSEALEYIVSSLAEVGVSYTFNLNQALNQLAEYTNFLTRFVDGLSDVVNGKLSTAIVPPHQLESILAEVDASIKIRRPHTHLIHVPTKSYYGRKNCVFVVHNNKLYIQLEVFTKYNNAQTYNLFEIITIPMPFDMSNTSTNARPYTQLIPSKKFFAVSEKSYMDLDPFHLKGCEVYDTLHVCPQATLQRDSDSMSCISSIWFNHSKSDILSHCEFRYFPKHKQEPHVLDTGNQVLISGFKTPWTVKCQYDFTVQHFEEVNYAVIPHSQLCGCAIIGEGMHVRTFLEGCYKERESFRPVFPVNAAVYLMSPVDLRLNLSKLYSSVQEISFKPSAPQILEADERSIAQEDDDDLFIDLLKVIELENNNLPIYESKEDLIILSDNVKSWFSNGNFSYILITIGSILGAAGIFISVYALFKGIRTAGMMSIIHALPKAEATQNYVSQSVSLDYQNLIITALINVVILVVVYVIYLCIRKIIKICNDKYFKLPINLDNSYKNYHTDIFVEIFDFHDYVRLKICSLEQHASNLESSIHTQISIRHHERNLINDTIMLDYNDSLLVCKSANSMFQLPSFVYVPFNSKFKLRKMLKYDRKQGYLKTRIIAVSQNFVYDLLRIINKVSYAENVETQTSFVPIVLPAPAPIAVPVPAPIVLPISAPIIIPDQESISDEFDDYMEMS